MADAKAPITDRFNATEVKHIMAGLSMLMQSTKRAENQMRQSNREAVADALKTEVMSIADTASHAQRVL